MLLLAGALRCCVLLLLREASPLLLLLSLFLLITLLFFLLTADANGAVAPFAAGGMRSTESRFTAPFPRRLPAPKLVRIIFPSPDTALPSSLLRLS